ncbi:unnamed protein product [Zymoseptoria tritici ST99CH_3D7]|uniref:Chitin-binding type-2 domain-containing protein n=1 Tax=Zymoseptoria tritici (strain ST99CH_3D7) TaxID=1276538 RepID=A0A1X7S2W9_ZYMT9|nr:unnamed protein product [Zymoseptoria tritici ST99CH_3D7]
MHIFHFSTAVLSMASLAFAQFTCVGPDGIYPTAHYPNGSCRGSSVRGKPPAVYYCTANAACTVPFGYPCYPDYENDEADCRKRN